MPKKLAVIVIHGMGSQCEDFAEDSINELNERIAAHGKSTEDIAWKSIYWADLLEPRQTKYLRQAKRKSDIDYIEMRRFVLTALGDAAAYQKVKSAYNSAYKDIHARIEASVKELYAVDLESQACPIVVLAHSLGGHIMSNYIWDMQCAKPETMSAFERFDHHAGMITFGCNIPLFTFAYKRVKPIKFPGAALSQTEQAKAKWLNYFDPDDILGYPLKPINKAYEKIVDKDIAINVGGLFSSWNPASHGAYWTDNHFTKPVAQYLCEYL